MSREDALRRERILAFKISPNLVTYQLELIGLTTDRSDTVTDTLNYHA